MLEKKSEDLPCHICFGIKTTHTMYPRGLGVLMVKRFFFGFILHSVCLLLLPQALRAQGAARIISADTLQNVNVVSTHRDADLRSTAPRYSLSSQDFGTYGVTDIGDALHRLPGITLRDYGGAGGMKTVSVRGFGDAHTSVIYDGVALSDCQSGQIDLSRYSLDNVSALTLVVGDDDNIFQPARNMASAASMKIITSGVSNLRGDTARNTLTAQMRLGVWGYTNPFLSIDRRLGRRFSINIMGEYLYVKNDYPYELMNGRMKNNYHRENNRMKSGHGEVNVAYRHSDAGATSLKLYFYDNSRQLPGMARLYVNDNKETLHDQNIFAQLAGWQQLSEALQMKYSGKFNYAMTDYADPAYPDHIHDHKYWQREWYASGAWVYNVNVNGNSTTPALRREGGGNLSVGYSVDYFFNNFTGSDEAEYSDPVRHTILQALSARYAKGRFSAIIRGLLSLYINKVEHGQAADNISHFSPSVSVNYQLLPDEKLYVRASYKDIFRSPSFNELYYFHYGSPVLKPERTNQFNVGVTWVKKHTDTTLSLSADVYFNNVKDKIVAVPYNMFIWTNINVGKVHTFGIDLTGSVTHHLSARHTLLLTGNYTLQKVRDKTPGSETYDLQIAYTPEHSGSVALSWQNPWVDISLHEIGRAHV